MRALPIVPIGFVPLQAGYMQMAALMFAAGHKFFKVRPKIHMMGEIGLELLQQGLSDRLSLSPIVTATWSDEDFIGRVSRVSRACHGSTVSISTMRRCLGMYSMQFEKTAAKKRGHAR